MTVSTGSTTGGAGSTTGGAGSTAGGARTGVEKSDLVTLTIDGIEVSVPKDTLVIRARGGRRPDPALL